MVDSGEAALVSVVGEGLMTDAPQLTALADCLERAGIATWGLFAATLSVSALVPEAAGEPAARALHDRFVARRD
jgi:aspartokinase